MALSLGGYCQWPLVGPCGKTDTDKKDIHITDKFTSLIKPMQTTTHKVR